jgi:alanine racemase
VTGIVRRAPIESRLAAAGLPPLPRTAWLEIDLDALRSNLGVLRDLAGPGAAIRPVVKADAYGHGAVPIARALEAMGVDVLCVATMDEALELRNGGVTAPLVVLYPIPAAWAAEAARLGVAVAVGDTVLLAELLSAVREAPHILEIELEVETGLGRGGFAGESLLEAAQQIERSPSIRLASLWTHFQEVDDVPLTRVQLDRFEAAAALLTQAGVTLPSRHAAASAALLNGGVATYDGARPGLAIYGLLPDELEASHSDEAAAGLRPILAMYARPVRVADLPADWGVSYGPTFRTARPSRIATLPFGYGDGWPRQLSNRASASVRGVRVPLVGNVAMDAVMADVTDVPGEPVDVHDEFVLIGTDEGERITVADLAHTRTTNRWEVVTNLSRRIPRVYHAAAGPVVLRALANRGD